MKRTSSTTNPRVTVKAATPSRAAKPRASKSTAALKSRTAPESTTAPAMGRSEALSESAIAVRAYEIFIARNGAPGDPVSDWLQAERELRAAD
jgi:hypothetical protein